MENKNLKKTSSRDLPAVPQKARLIDLDKVIRKQDNKMVRNLPQFLINLIKRIVKQKSLNRLISNNRELMGVDFVKACMKDNNTRFEVKGLENIPEKGRYIFVSNHPLGAADYGSLIVSLSKKFKKVKVLANEVLTHVDNFKGLFLPVSVFGKTGDKAKRDIDKAMQSEDMQILTFPAGTVSRKNKGKIEDADWHRSFIRNAINHQREVIPIYVDAVNSRFFYFIAGLRKFFRLKINIELFFIPGEFFKKRNKTIPVYIGKPIPASFFDESKSHLEWAQEVKRHVYRLSQVSTNRLAR